ncbi:Uncharacterised protein [Slackia heliotrinireducens]|uniref:Uncharacterized protein n=1 Tax=Slackia heliotrinireducens (strain ATCC 29202 / DSM 20476 / NCTC 11029 / RHS 1) TaxID=471855 RepID=C7N746_SLAHD|nr:hypothetical protein [Slackia heliotrinireducens]ACV22731.1 hypothetical protein Shel_17120 [Slackia heliotrinireducens DSM 20476]VEH01368.1 Uncharacterised protein [Slackia heliotrinireducens]
MKHAMTALAAALGLSVSLLSACAGAPAQSANDAAGAGEAVSQEAVEAGEPAEEQGCVFRTDETAADVDASVKTFSVQEEAGEGAVVANIAVATAACDGSGDMPEASYTTVTVTLRDESGEGGLSERPMDAVCGMAVAVDSAGGAPVVRAAGSSGQASVTGASGASYDVAVSQPADDGMTVSVTDENGEAAVVTIALADEDGPAAMGVALTMSPSPESGLTVVESDATESASITCYAVSEADNHGAAIARTVLVDVPGTRTRDIEGQTAGETTSESTTARSSWNKEVTTTVESTPTTLDVHDIAPSVTVVATYCGDEAQLSDALDVVLTVNESDATVVSTETRTKREMAAKDGGVDVWEYTELEYDVETTEEVQSMDASYACVSAARSADAVEAEALGSDGSFAYRVSSSSTPGAKTGDAGDTEPLTHVVVTVEAADGSLPPAVLTVQSAGGGASERIVEGVFGTL